MTLLKTDFTSGTQFTAGSVLGAATGLSGLNNINFRVNSAIIDDYNVSGNVVQGIVGSFVNFKVSNNAVIGGSLTLEDYAGAWGNNLRIGDDIILCDIDVLDTVGLKGQNNAHVAAIRFGSPAGGIIMGTSPSKLDFLSSNLDNIGSMYISGQIHFKNPGTNSLIRGGSASPDALSIKIGDGTGWRVNIRNGATEGIVGYWTDLGAIDTISTFSASGITSKGNMTVNGSETIKGNLVINDANDQSITISGANATHYIRNYLGSLYIYHGTPSSPPYTILNSDGNISFDGNITNDGTIRTLGSLVADSTITCSGLTNKGNSLVTGSIVSNADLYSSGATIKGKVTTQCIATTGSHWITAVDSDISNGTIRLLRTINSNPQSIVFGNGPTADYLIGRGIGSDNLSFGYNGGGGFVPTIDFGIGGTIRTNGSIVGSLTNSFIQLENRTSDPTGPTGRIWIRTDL